jgi:hypothetical protein
LVGVLLIWVLWKLGRWGVRRWRKRQPGWWRVNGKKWTRRIMVCGPRKKGAERTPATQTATDEERRPLLV